jgi:hypothetical protein
MNMNDTKPIQTDPNEQVPVPNRRKNAKWQIIALVALGLVLILVSAWFTWLKPFFTETDLRPAGLTQHLV